MKSSCPVNTGPTIALVAGVAPVNVIVGRVVSVVNIHPPVDRLPVVVLRSIACTLR